MASSNASLADELKKYVSQHKVFEPLTTLLNSQGAVMHLKPVVGNAAFERKDYMEAIRCYSEAIELQTTNHVLFSNRSACYAALGGRNTEAISDAEKCIALCPSFVKGYYRLSTAKMENGVYNEAVEAAKAGLKVEPNNPDLNRQLRIINTKQAARGLSATRGKGKRADGAAKGSHMDEGTLQEIQELGQSVQHTQRDLLEARAQLQACMREMKKFDLTRKELDRLSDNTPLYRSVGKVFIFNDRGEINKSLEAGEKEKNNEASQAELKIKYLEGR